VYVRLKIDGDSADCEKIWVDWSDSEVVSLLVSGLDMMKVSVDEFNVTSMLELGDFWSSLFMMTVWIFHWTSNSGTLKSRSKSFSSMAFGTTSAGMDSTKLTGMSMPPICSMMYWGTAKLSSGMLTKQFFMFRFSILAILEWLLLRSVPGMN